MKEKQVVLVSDSLPLIRLGGRPNGHLILLVQNTFYMPFVAGLCTTDSERNSNNGPIGLSGYCNNTRIYTDTAHR